MSNVTHMHHALPLSVAINKAITDLDSAIAKTAGLPQGLIVAELHGHAHAQTHMMVKT